MRGFTAAIVIGPLMLSGALASAAGQSSSFNTQNQLVASSDSTADRDTYTQRARGEMQEWQRKLHDFSEMAKANGQKAGKAAENGLTAAWAKTEAEARRLQSASADGWESAKSSYEKASHELADAWDKARR
jgi:hypothetical protein